MEEESRKSFAQITLYNQLIKEMDDLYRVYAKNCNLSESAFWILYCIQEREKEAFTQREICDYWFRNIPENYEKAYGIFPGRNRGTDKTGGSRVIAGTSEDDTKMMPA